MTLYQQWLGTASARPNFYELLGLPADEPTPAIVQAAAAQTRQRLTAQAPGDALATWQAILREIDVAAQTLAQPTLRAEYDRYVLGQGAAAASDAFILRLTSAATEPLATTRQTASSIRPASAMGLDPMAPIGRARPAVAPGPTATPAPVVCQRVTDGPAPATTAPGSASPAMPRIRARPKRRANPYVGPAVAIVLGVVVAGAAVAGAYLYSTGAWDRLIAEDPDASNPAGGSSAPQMPPTETSTEPPAPATVVRPTEIESPVPTEVGAVDVMRPGAGPTPTSQPAAPEGMGPTPISPTRPGDAMSPGAAMPSGDGMTPTEVSTSTGPTAPEAPTTPPASADEVAAVTTVLRQAYEQLQMHDVAAARASLAQGEAKATHPSQKARLAAMQALADQLDSFWMAVQTTLVKLGTMEDLQVGSTVGTVVESSKTSLTIRVAGRNRTYALHEIPAGLANVLAERGLDPGDPMTPVTLGTIFAVQNPPRVDEARSRWESGLARGAEVAEVMPILGEIGALAGPSGGT